MPRQPSPAIAERNAAIVAAFEGWPGLRRDLAAHFGLSPSQLSKVLCAAGYNTKLGHAPKAPYPRPNAERDAEIVELSRQGLTRKEVAARFGISAVRVTQIAVAAGLKLDHEERLSRAHEANTGKERDPAWRAKIGEAMRAAWAESRAHGRRVPMRLAFKDKAEAQLYRKLKKALGAEAARRELRLYERGEAK